MILEIKDIVEIPKAELNIHCTLFEDNKDTEELSKVSQNRPGTKHIAVRYHHFREAVRKGHLKVTRVVTTEQLADIFTKA